VSNKTKELASASYARAQRSFIMLANEGTLLSYTDKCLLHIARAFVLNPDVLIIHKPIEHFNDLHSLLVLELLREFVSGGGIERPAHDNPLHRHPRTCIFSASSVKSTETADLVLHVGKHKVHGMSPENLNLVQVTARKLFSTMDKDRNNQVNRTEFVDVVYHESWVADFLGLSLEGCQDNDEALKTRLGEVFDDLDVLQCGYVDYEDIERFLRGRVDADLPQVLSSIRRTTEGPGEIPSEAPRPDINLKNTPQAESVGGLNEELVGAGQSQAGLVRQMSRV
jgi:hypothetical protein